MRIKLDALSEWVIMGAGHSANESMNTGMAFVALPSKVQNGVASWLVDGRSVVIIGLTPAQQPNLKSECIKQATSQWRLI